MSFQTVAVFQKKVKGNGVEYAMYFKGSLEFSELALFDKKSSIKQLKLRLKCNLIIAKTCI